MVISDLSDPQSIILNTSGNIYAIAAQKLKLNSQECVHNSMTSLTEFHKQATRTVETTETVTIGGDNTINVNGNQTVNVVKIHAVNVGGNQDVFVQGDQSLTVKGLQKIDVGKNMEIEVGIDYKLHAKGKSDIKYDGDCKWFKNGHSYGINLSSDEVLKLSNTTGINIGIKEEANIALSEALNVGGSLEQTFAMKRSSAYGVNMVTNYAATIEKDTGVKSCKVGVAEKYSSGIVQDEFQAAMTKSKLVKWGAKMMLLT